MELHVAAVIQEERATSLSKHERSDSGGSHMHQSEGEAHRLAVLGRACSAVHECCVQSADVGTRAIQSASVRPERTVGGQRAGLPPTSALDVAQLEIRVNELEQSAARRAIDGRAVGFRPQHHVDAKEGKRLVQDDAGPRRQKERDSRCRCGGIDGLLYLNGGGDTHGARRQGREWG